MKDTADATRYRMWWAIAKKLWIAVFVIQAVDLCLFPFGPKHFVPIYSWLLVLHQALFYLTALLLFTTIPCWLGMLRRYRSVPESEQWSSIMGMLRFHLLATFILRETEAIDFIYLMPFSFIIGPFMMWRAIKEVEDRTRKEIQAKFHSKKQVLVTPKEQMI